MFVFDKIQTLFGRINYIEWLKKSLIAWITKAINFTWWKTELDWADSDLLHQRKSPCWPFGLVPANLWQNVETCTVTMGQNAQVWTLLYIFLYFSDRASSYNSGRWPTWHTVSSMICLFESSTCFKQLCAHPQEDSCINHLKTKHRPLYLKTQSVPRCKHFSSQL